MIGVGLIGFGLAGRVLHAPVIAAVPDLQIVAVATSRADEVRAAFPDARVTDAAGVLGDPAVDLVVVATPNDSHAPLARAALEAGRHVVVDKPFVLDPAQGEALIALAAERERVLSVFQNRRWDGDFLTVRRVLDSGVLGEVRLAEMHWDRLRPAIKPGWREQTGEGSGLLADLGPHLVDQGLQLFGMPQTVSADVTTQRQAAAVDDYFALTLQYGRSRVLLSASTLVAAPRPRFALHGTAASLVKHGLDPQEAVLRAGGSVQDPGFGEDALIDYATLTRADGTRERVPSERGDWRCFYAGVADAIQHGAPPPVDPREALAGLQLIALARQSAREGRVVTI